MSPRGEAPQKPPIKGLASKGPGDQKEGRCRHYEREKSAEKLRAFKEIHIIFSLSANSVNRWTCLKSMLHKTCVSHCAYLKVPLNPIFWRFLVEFGTCLAQCLLHTNGRLRCDDPESLLLQRSPFSQSDSCDLDPTVPYIYCPPHSPYTTHNGFGVIFSPEGKDPFSLFDLQQNVI